VACGICAAKRGSFSGARKKKEEEYISNTIYLANVTHFPWAKYVIKLTLISPLDCS